MLAFFGWALVMLVVHSEMLRSLPPGCVPEEVCSAVSPSPPAPRDLEYVALMSATFKRVLTEVRPHKPASRSTMAYR